MFDFLSNKFSGIFQWMQGKKVLTQDNISQAIMQVKEALLQADVPNGIIDEFLQEVSNEVVGKQITLKTNPGDKFIKVVHDCLVRFLGEKQQFVLPQNHKPIIVLMLGLQGSGKTTTLAKIANYSKKAIFKDQKNTTVLLGSVDFQRPAAIDQLRILASQAGVDFYQAASTSPVDAAQEIVEHARKAQCDMVLIDTAGRLQIDDVLMQELAEISRAINPHVKLFVLDTMTGQESLNVAQAFESRVGFDAAVLSKMDSQSRGGAAFAFRYVLKKPIAFVGSGEKIDDLERFYPERMATRILGMGDLASLLEKADEIIDKKKQDDMASRFFEGAFTLDDFATQLAMVTKMGSLSKVMAYLPGVPKVSSEMIEQGQREMTRFKALLSSMTLKERKQPALLSDRSRRQRIVKGAGCSADDLNKLMIRFEQSKQFAKMYKKSGKLPNFF